MAGPSPAACSSRWSTARSWRASPAIKGYTASGGARGVGRAVTMAAVYTNLYIVIANFVTSHLLEQSSQIRRASGLGA